MPDFFSYIFKVKNKKKNSSRHSVSQQIKELDRLIIRVDFSAKQIH